MAFVEEGFKPEDLGEPVHDGKVLFAGEATHNHYFGTSHGAMLSGTREAKRIIDESKC